MIKSFSFLFLWIPIANSAQEINCIFIAKIPLQADRFVGVDDFDNVYYVTGNVFYKKRASDSIPYNNIQLGDIGNIDILNPLEITVFYPDFNTVIKLDNTLNEITKIDFNQREAFRNIQYTTTANDKNLWIFNSDLQQLERFNYQTRELIPINQPLNQNVIAQKSNYNFCWLLTPTTLLKYNIYGNLLSATPVRDYEDFSQSRNLLILKKNNRLFCKKEGSDNVTLLKISGITVKDFYINANNLYIYDGENVHHYQLNLSKRE